MSTDGSRQYVEITIVSTVAILTCALFGVGSTFIEVIHESSSFIPLGIDYLRTFILGAFASFVVNYLFKFVDKSFMFCKIWLEFLALLLLAYPQRTQTNHVTASWNLVQREAYLFGLFYQMISLLFYLYDFWTVELNQDELLRLNSSSGLEDVEAKIHEEVLKKATLENCINIRRHSSNLKKVIYSEDYIPGQLGEMNYEYQPSYGSTISTPHNQQSQAQNKGSMSKDLLGSELIGDSIDHFSNQSHSGVVPSENTVVPSTTYGSIITAAVSRSSAFTPESTSIDKRWVLENTLWILVTTIYEIGIALTLSITFIYVPEVDDSRYSFLELYFYNKINLFCMEVIFPLFIITSIMQILLHSHAQKPSQRLKIFGAFSSFSLVLFIFGLFVA